MCGRTTARCVDCPHATHCMLTVTVQKHKGASAFKDKGFPQFDNMALLVDKIIATGNGAIHLAKPAASTSASAIKTTTALTTKAPVKKPAPASPSPSAARSTPPGLATQGPSHIDETEDGPPLGGSDDESELNGHKENTTRGSADGWGSGAGTRACSPQSAAANVCAACAP